MVRFPSPQEHALWAIWTMDTFYPAPLLRGDISNHIVGSLIVCKICMLCIVCKTSGESSAGGGVVVAKS